MVLEAESKMRLCSMFLRVATIMEVDKRLLSMMTLFCHHRDWIGLFVFFTYLMILLHPPQQVLLLPPQQVSRLDLEVCCY